MTGAELKHARLTVRWTQQQAAHRLGVTQAYLSMVERGSRPVSAELTAKVVEVFQISPTALPLGPYRFRALDEKQFKEALGALAYAGFSYLRGGERMNPADLLLQALDSEDLDARVAEALPWLPVAFPQMDWVWLTRNAKLHDRQNRLAYVVHVASQVAERKGDRALAASLASRVQELERSRLAQEDTLCSERITKAERRWLATNRPEAAEHWNLLTNLSVNHLDHAFH
ncbi:Transcriptional regulator, contains XRE-family HTH domain [Granulicella rosea]|uniref:Transcriptional regulator, contains XRE-family HTH domain n=1 Tax=Granulicella rosea TaxID=474952 RepID=A0A239LWU8_9BACT|nr:helix-turn-helix transcriptional regulator [Granulicella rosea]SNT35127.1 Transcriptional regulator, contains XRE-family HTH domain [Granulicella rosea]